MFCDRFVKIVLGFEIKLYCHCLDAFGFQRSLVDCQLAHSQLFKSFKMNLQGKRYGVSNQRGLNFFSKHFKQNITVLDFEIKLFPHCFVAFRVQRSIVDHQLVHTQLFKHSKQTHNEKDMRFSNQRGLKFFFKKFQTKYHSFKF